MGWLPPSPDGIKSAKKVVCDPQRGEDGEVKPLAQPGSEDRQDNADDKLN
jgi:hypothetical protein